MNDAFNIYPTVIYTFRFRSTDKTVQLTQQQLDDIPYLSTLIAHKDDFLSCQNENDEYVLNYPIEYSWFIPILRYITSKNLYKLFDELSENENILDILQLFDYLCIESLPLPHLKDEDLVLSNPTNTENKNKRVKYYKANLSEARQTAAEFIVALANNQYKLQHSYTRKFIFTLINIILFNTDVFNTQFRHYTLAIAKKRCYSFFSKSQQNQIQTTDRIAQTRKIHSSIYLTDDSKPLPKYFQNAFSWKGDYVEIEDNQTYFTCVNSNGMIPTTTYQFDHTRWPSLVSSTRLYFDAIWSPFHDDDWLIYLDNLSDDLWDIEVTPIDIHDDNKIWINELKQDRKENEARSARLGHFNTLSKQPKVDKFKHRCGPKAQKYR